MFRFRNVYDVMARCRMQLQKDKGLQPIEGGTLFVVYLAVLAFAPQILII